MLKKILEENIVHISKHCPCYCFYLTADSVILDTVRQHPLCDDLGLRLDLWLNLWLDLWLDLRLDLWLNLCVHQL